MVKFSKRKSPFSSVTFWTDAPPNFLCAVTFAPAIGEPFGSLMRPLKLYVVWV
ncbi:MAG: hypothetical protein M3Q78_04180 [Acidobacteriota bacterium]|nr:hypothetical protein [Acidobacteriota bacterium]